VPDPSLSLRQGAIAPWAKTGNTSPYYTQTLEALCKHYGFKHVTPLGRPAGEGAATRSCYGSGEERSPSSMMTGCAPTRPRSRSKASSATSSGAGGNRQRLGARGAVAFQSTAPCPACDGYRLKPEALAVKINGCTSASTELSIREANDWFNELPASSMTSRTRSPRASSRKSATG
jgi:excinuclease ABC subunit A